MLCFKLTTFVVVLMTCLIGESLATENKVQETDTNSLEHKTAEEDFRSAIAIPRQYPPQFGGPSGVGGGFGGGGDGGGFGGGGGSGFGGGGGSGFGGAGGGVFGGGCPLCDSSVYSYCSHRLLHDSCCCDFPGTPYIPPQCMYLQCAQLYAKSCYEFSLIKNCCCNNPY